jgi:hypothetical protein
MSDVSSPVEEVAGKRASLSINLREIMQKPLDDIGKGSSILRDRYIINLYILSWPLDHVIDASIVIEMYIVVI